jgi:hypothetical protein
LLVDTIPEKSGLIELGWYQRPLGLRLFVVSWYFEWEEYTNPVAPPWRITRQYLFTRSRLDARPECFFSLGKGDLLIAVNWTAGGRRPQQLRS